MPIRPEMKARYPANWKEIRERILERAGHCCERCGAGNYWDVQRLDPAAPASWTVVGFDPIKANCWPFFVMAAVNGMVITTIVLTIAHVHDPDPANCADDNLQALCQRCHLVLDAPLHAATRRARRAIGDLFECATEDAR